MKNKIYISGPITGLPQKEVEQIFSRIADNLNSLGWEAVNPLNNGLPAEASYNEHMLRDLEMLAECRAIFMLKGWERSKGARIEFAEAVARKMTIMFE